MAVHKKMPGIDCYRHLTLRAKLALWVSCGVSLLVVALMSALLVTMRHDLTRTAAQAQSALIDSVVSDLDGKLQARRAALELEGTALGARPHPVEHAALDDFFAGRPLLLSLFDVVILADASGAIVYDSTAADHRSDRSLGDRAYFREALQSGRTVVSRPLAGKATGKPVVTLATPVHDRAGRIRTVLVGVLRLDASNFLSRVATRGIGTHGYFTLMTRDAPIVIAHPDARRLLTPVGANAGTLAEAALRAGETTEGVADDGSAALLSFRALATAPWIVAAIYPVEEALAPLRLRQRQMLAAGLSAALLAGLMVRFLTARLFAPIDKLRQALELDARGSQDLLRSIRADSSDMAALLHAYYEQKSRRQAVESALATSERHLRDITDNLPAMVAYIDTDETYRFANAHFRHAMGIDPAQVLGTTMTQFLGPKARAELGPHIEAALRGERRTFERTGWVQNAETHFFVEYVPDIATDGAVRGFFVMVLDISQRRRAELALAHSQARIRAIADNLPALISHYDRDQRCTFANAAVGAVFGCEPGALVGRTASEVHGTLLHATTGPNIVRALDGDVVFFEASMPLADGRLAQFECNYIPQRDTAGRVVGFYALTIEVTQRKRTQQELHASQQLLDRAGKMANVGGWQVDMEAGTVTWTAQTRRIHEVDDDYTPTLETAVEFYDAAGRPVIEEAVQRGLRDGTPWDVQLPLRTAKGRLIWVQATGEVEFDAGRPVRLFGAIQDVTQRVAIERQLREQAELLQVTLTSIGDGVITTDEAGRVRWMNPAAERLTGRDVASTRGEALPQVFRIVDAETRTAPPDPVGVCLGTVQPANAAGRSVLISAAGREFAIEETARPIRDEHGTVLGAVLVFHDVSEQRRMSDQLTHRATHDELTGLVNRHCFEARLGMALNRVREGDGVGALMFIDLDQFKLVNDACGHAVGDTLLRQASALMGKRVRSRDTLARLGGDEFGVILEHCTVEQAQRVAQGICDEMEEFRFVHDGRKFRIGASIGLVPIDSRWPGTDELMQAADSACYRAKEAGRNRVQVWFDSDAATLEREGETQWGSRIENALDDGNFVLYAQRIAPVGRAAAGLHCEVLLRLRQADGSIVAPGKFLPAAERFHMASRIDRWVVRAVFQWLSAQGDAGDIETVAINLSGQSIGDRAFQRHVVQLLNEIPIDAGKVCFEITETAAITNLAEAGVFIQAMRVLGMRIALDDFGAGASSFGYLKKLPVDYLKIDGQFIRNVTNDPLDMAAVRCFHEVARAIGVETVAEFVETDMILQTLRDIGIDHVQGYLIHRPEPLDALLGAWRHEPLSCLAA